MPTYQYRCKDCHESLDAVQNFAEPALTECPACGGRLRKIFSSVGVVFKGSGFYRTDSREKPDSADSEPKRKAETTAESKTEGKAKTKSEVSSEPKPDTATKTPASTTKSSDTSSAA